VPTDPFVYPDPSSRPRQQQNLPPGVALPPATRWLPDRPGDVPADSAEESRFGSPGPNVGYAYTLAERVKDRLRLAPSERGHDVVAVVAEVAGKRAASFGRAPVIGDVEFAMSILGYDETVDPEYAARRATLVHEAAHDYRRRRAVVDRVPEALARKRPNEAKAEIEAWRTGLAARVQQELRDQATA
jgi:hypothetical protein